MSDLKQSCPTCGRHTTSNSKFCGTCGTRLPTSNPTLPDARPQQSPLSGYRSVPPPERQRRSAGCWITTIAVVLSLALLSGAAFQGWQFRSTVVAQATAIASSKPPAAEPGEPPPRPAPTPEAPPPPTADQVARAEPPTATPDAAIPTPTVESAATGFAQSEATLAAIATEQQATAFVRASTATALSGSATVAAAARQTSAVESLADATTATTTARQTTIAEIGQTSTALAEQIASAVAPPPLYIYMLADLPVYPAAQPTNPDNDFAQGIKQSLYQQQTASKLMDVNVYTMPPDVPFEAITSFYDSELAALGWQQPDLQDPPTVAPDLDQQLAVWSQGNQQFIVSLVRGEAVQESTGGGGYLVLTLITRYEYE